MCAIYLYARAHTQTSFSGHVGSKTSSLVPFFSRALSSFFSPQNSKSITRSNWYAKMRSFFAPLQFDLSIMNLQSLLQQHIKCSKIAPPDTKKNYPSYLDLTTSCLWWWWQAFYLLDIVFALIFVVEAVLRIIASGLVCAQTEEKQRRKLQIERGTESNSWFEHALPTRQVCGQGAGISAQYVERTRFCHCVHLLSWRRPRLAGWFALLVDVRGALVMACSYVDAYYCIYL